MNVQDVLFVLIMQFLWLYIDELVGKGLSLWVIIEFLAWGSATLFPLALPLATLLASIMTLGNMGENNELLALKAAGISLPRILSPLFIFLNNSFVSSCVNTCNLEVFTFAISTLLIKIKPPFRIMLFTLFPKEG